MYKIYSGNLLCACSRDAIFQNGGFVIESTKILIIPWLHSRESYSSGKALDALRGMLFYSSINIMSVICYDVISMCGNTTYTNLVKKCQIAYIAGPYN